MRPFYHQLGNICILSCSGVACGALGTAESSAAHSSLRSPTMRLVYIIAFGASLLAVLPAGAAGIDWSSVDQALGKAGADQPGGVRRYSLPRTDLHIALDGIPVRPQLALGSWVAFEPIGRVAMLMGDLVLTQKEVAPV